MRKVWEYQIDMRNRHQWQTSRSCLQMKTWMGLTCPTFQRSHSAKRDSLRRFHNASHEHMWHIFLFKLITIEHKQSLYENINHPSKSVAYCNAKQQSCIWSPSTQPKNDHLNNSQSKAITYSPLYLIQIIEIKSLHQ